MSIRVMKIQHTVETCPGRPCSTECDHVEFEVVGDVTTEVLADWLIVNGLAEERRGYGHADGQEVAEKLLHRFAMSWREGGSA